ncbi:hypothetical protein [Pedobacter sp. JY14-1]|uniref:hypothetical protein n=1 Tax=Pedobacter sp. JY14-1 TaxID=3034151 RepID=UPI0023E350B0|nr:hypothetical protein [Pedobacter sp. JY14-1]
MKNNRKGMYSSKIALAVVALLLVSCKDFIEPSLEKREVRLLAPMDGSESNRYQVGFNWESVADALRYRLQIAAPDFEHTVSMVQDTIIEGRTRFEMTMEPGKYQWRLRAENGSSQSGYATAGFTIHESSLTEQKVTLNTPGTNYLSSEANVGLGWNKLFGATGYQLQIDKDNFADEDDLVYDAVLSGNVYQFTFPEDGSYQWRVRAQNEKENSKWSEVRTLGYDKTAPAVPAPVSPVKGAQVSLPVSISWTAVNTAKKYRLYLYKSDGVSNYSTGFPLLVNTNSYSFSTGQQGELVYWKVTALDQAGNESPASELMNFSIQ